MAEKIDNKYASSEYSEECVHLGQDFRLKTVSETVSIVGGPMSEPVAAEPGAPGMNYAQGSDGVYASRPAKLSKDVDVIEMTALASVTQTEDGRIEIRYDETIDEDAPPVVTCLSFDPNEPGLVTLERRGILRSVMMFEEGQYRRCDYVTPIMSFEMTVHSRIVDNKLTADGGTLYMDYTIQTKGVATQRVKLSVEVVRI